MRKELFLSRLSALKACVENCKGMGVPETTIIKRSRAVPVYRRGELVGYHAFVPVNATVVAPIMEGVM